MNRCDLFVSGEDGYSRYRIPALILLPQGGLLAFCEARRHNGADDDEIDILLRRSEDGGCSWGPRKVVVSDGDRSCGNPCPVIDADSGAVVLPFCKDNQEVFVTRSEDDGATWTIPRDITAEVKDSNWSYLGTGPGHGICLHGGRLLVPCWCDESPGPVTWRKPPASWGQVQSSYAAFSDDGGRTWERGEKMTHDASDECEAVETADGRVYMTVRHRGGGKHRGYGWSEDGGRTWSAVRYDDDLPEPSCQGSILSYDDRHILMAHPASLTDRSQLTIRLSVDQCLSWPVDRILYPGPAAYSDLAVNTNGEVLCLYEADDYERLELARFSLEWLK